MPIDKTIPKILQADLDQRLVRPESGEMLDALNVVVREDGSNSAGVVKNTRGTVAVNPNSSDDRIPDGMEVEAGVQVYVIGKAEDHQNGHIYWFIAQSDSDPAAIAQYSAIYRHNVSQNTYEPVLSGDFLGFYPNSRIKADIVNSDVQGTLLYFTDNINPPRKINVNRALSGDYALDPEINGQDIDFAINTIKGAPLTPMTFNFVTNDDVSVNNFEKVTHQFAMQYIYVDGEESAIGPYSKLAYPDTISASGLEGDESGLLFFTDNECQIQTHYRANENQGNDAVNRMDVEKLRLLGRHGNNGAWFVIDEFLANENLTRDGYGLGAASGLIYNAETGIYRYFNDQEGAGVSDNDVFKLYDDVPFQAEGQAIAGNRLMYSNYTSGRPNTNPSANITPIYDGGDSGDGTVIIAESEIDDLLVEETSTGFYADIDLLGTANLSGLTDVIPGGTMFNLQIQFNLDFIVHSGSATEGLVSTSYVYTDQGSTPGNYEVQLVTGSSLTPWRINTGNRSYDLSYGITEDITVDDFIDDFEEFVDTELTDFKFKVTSGNINSGGSGQMRVQSSDDPDVNVGTFVSINGSDAGEVTIRFRVERPTGTNVIRIQPYVRNVNQYFYETNGNQNLWTVTVDQQPFNLGSQSATHPFGGLTTTTAGLTDPSVLGANSSIVAKSFFAVPTFKAGCTHELGVVYYDKFNRSGNVNKLGSFYALHQVERPVGSTNKGAVRARIDFQSDAPDWAEKYQIVYPGMGSFDDFQQYTTGQAFAPRDTDGELITNRKQLYVSLNTIENYKLEKNGDRQYSFTEGDKLRVIKFSDTGGNAAGDWRYDTSNTGLGEGNGAIVEFNVVGVEVLGKDAENNPICGSERAMREGQTINFGFSNESNTPSGGSGFISSSVSVFRLVGGVYSEITSQINPPSFTDIKVASNGDIESMVVNHPGGPMQPTDKLSITFSGPGGTNPTFDHILTSASLGGVTDTHSGTFVVIEAPQVAAGISFDGTNELKYQGWDWFSVTGEDYPDGASTSAIASKWGKHSVVEIVTPKTTKNKIYYEIGEARTTGAVISRDQFGNPYTTTTHGLAITVVGDAYLRATPANGPKYENNAWVLGPPDEWGYTNIEMESHSVSDFFKSRDWNKGRPHAVFENSATTRKRNGIVYSDAFEEDVAKLSLSSFNASLANFFNLESGYGACRYIAPIRDKLVALQENRVSKIMVNEQVLNTADQSSIASLSTNVLNSPFYYEGDFGCANNPESALVADGQFYFVDPSRKKVLRLTNEGLSVISENGIDSLFKSEYDASVAALGTRTRLISGYDPEDNTYLITMRPGGTYNGFTAGYDVRSNSWVSRYSFAPDMYARMNDDLYSATYRDPQGNNNAEIFFNHRVNDDGDNYNTFYGDPTALTTIRIVSNYNPSMVKVFNALSLETNSTNWTIGSVSDNLGGTGRVQNLVQKEGSLYGAVTRDTSANSTMHIIPLGEIESVTNNVVTFTKRVNTLPLMPGATVMRNNNGTLENIGPFVNNLPTPLNFAGLPAGDPRSITLSGTSEILAAGEDLVLVTLSDQNGDPIRGHWAEIGASNQQNTAMELFCINTHYADSKQNHAMGQQ